LHDAQVSAVTLADRLLTYLKVIGLVMPHPAHEHVERIAAVDCGLDFVAVARERAGAECA
jgi:hypothetical protein